MPVVDTHHRFLLKKAEANKFDRSISDTNTLVSNVTFDILKESPALVADVANGMVERAVLETAIVKVIDRQKYHLGLFREEIVERVLNFMFGYGELQKYIEDEDITDIDGTRFDEFVIKKNGVRKKIPISFGNEKIFDTYCKIVAVRNGGILNENDSHCRVTDEKYRLRINVSVKPRNVESPAISIRKHRKTSYTLEDLVGLGMMNDDIAKFISNLALSDATILFCGKGAAGKTTLLRAFVNILPEMERVLIAESDVEIYPDKSYCIEQRIKKENEGGRPVTLKDLIKTGLTMSLDTYCIGEITGDEAWEFVKAAFTGHRGLATTHSESAEDAFDRLLTLSKSGNVKESEKTIKDTMSKCIDVIFYLSSFKVVDVLEVAGYSEDMDKVIYNRLFKYVRDVKTSGLDLGLDFAGEFVKCGQPGERLKRLGVRG